ncbi:MAG: VWA domain-containing protein [Epsilonproteobacteria bacterium]|nr:VWA domain-containing protein [Campylobacterota bacterium]
MQFSLMYPLALLLLLLLPCFIWCKLKAQTLYFSKPEWLPKQTLAWDNLTLWLMAIYTLLVLALANPFAYQSQLSSQKKGRDLVLVLDTSGSMAERGFNTDNSSQSRYEVSTTLAKAFIKKRHDDNVGLVVFGSYAYSASPLTYDLNALAQMFDLMSDVGIAGTSTAIGDALMQGLRTLNAGEAKSKVLILLTDGQHNAGKSSPREAVNLAKEQGVKIYTIGIGNKGDYDEGLLSTIAKESGAKSFVAISSDELGKVYKSIDGLEPSPIRSEQYLNREQLFFYPLLLAVLGLFTLLWRYEESV